jgi:hypothetical protein
MRQHPSRRIVDGLDRLASVISRVMSKSFKLVSCVEELQTWLIEVDCSMSKNSGERSC